MLKNIIYLLILIVTINCFLEAAAAPNSPKTQALAKFKSYIPVIQKTNEACVGNYEAIVGDINNDSLEDVIVRFFLHPCEGGNLIVDSQAAIYLNKHGAVEVVGAFPHTPCGSVQSIDAGRIKVRYYECMPPYLKETGTAEFIYKNGQIVKLAEN